MGGIGLYGLDGFAVTQLTLKKTNISYCKQKKYKLAMTLSGSDKAVVTVQSLKTETSLSVIMPM